MQATHPYVPVGDARILATPVRRAQQLLQTVFVVLPIAAGVDKFFRLFTDWTTYLAPALQALLPFNPNYFMYAAGLVELTMGVVVAFRPRLGGQLLFAWLLLVTGNLVLAGGYHDIALRDSALALAALALAQLSAAWPRS